MRSSSPLSGWQPPGNEQAEDTHASRSPIPSGNLRVIEAESPHIRLKPRGGSKSEAHDAFGFARDGSGGWHALAPGFRPALTGTMRHPPTGRLPRPNSHRSAKTTQIAVLAPGGFFRDRYIPEPRTEEAPYPQGSLASSVYPSPGLEPAGGFVLATGPQTPPTWRTLAHQPCIQ